MYKAAKTLKLPKDQLEAFTANKSVNFEYDNSRFTFICDLEGITPIFLSNKEVKQVVTRILFSGCARVHQSSIFCSISPSS